MRERKKDLIQFLVWMRNGTAFCTTWFLILILINNSYLGIETITTQGLVKLIAVVVGGMFIFAGFFTGLFIRKWSFNIRLTGFMLLFSIYECAAFYWLGIFGREGTVVEWSVFVGVVVAMYLICMGGYQIYSKKKGDLYTQALQKYQKGRVEYEK